MKNRNTETEFQEIKKLLIAENLKSKEEIEFKIHRMIKTAKSYSVISGLLSLVLCIIFPRFSIFIILIFAIFMAWLWSSSISSKQYFQRYLDEIKQK